MKTRRIISILVAYCLLMGIFIVPMSAAVEKTETLNTIKTNEPDTSGNKDIIRNMTYTSPYGTPIIDGTVDTIWDNAEWTYIDMSSNGTLVSWDTVVRTKILNDDDNVYFLVEAHDTSHSTGVDYIEIFFDEENRANPHTEIESIMLDMDGGIRRDNAGMIDIVSNGIVTTENNTRFIEFSISLSKGKPTNLNQIGLEMTYIDHVIVDDIDYGVAFCYWNATEFYGINTGKLYFSEMSQDNEQVESEYTCPYVDITNHWAKEYIEFVDKEELVDGITETEFCPEAPMTREMFVIALARMMDVEDNYFDWAVDIGLILGYGNGDLGLDDTITREQMAVFFERYLKLTNTDISALKQHDKIEFADDSTISDWAKASVYTMQEISLIRGKDMNIFDPLAETSCYCPPTMT